MPWWRLGLTATPKDKTKPGLQLFALFSPDRRSPKISRSKAMLVWFHAGRRRREARS